MWGRRILHSQAPRRVLWISLQGHGQLEHSILRTVGVSSSILGGKGQKPDFGFLQRNGCIEWMVSGRTNEPQEVQWVSSSRSRLGHIPIISTSFSHSLKILSPWRKHGTRGIRVVLFFFYGCYCDHERHPEPFSMGELPEWKSACQQEEEL